jgi:hypothetical protein
MFLLVEKVQNTLSYKLKYVNMGSGMGVQYSKSDVPLDLDRLKNDVIVINNAGSYAAVLSPMQFSSQEKPVEVFLSVDDSVKIN